MKGSSLWAWVGPKPSPTFGISHHVSKCSNRALPQIKFREIIGSMNVETNDEWPYTWMRFDQTHSGNGAERDKCDPV
ncbi:hypothetical protein PAPYR_11767 [Paratrimastix pyriformis]|uniref:Uncharacterized protein n=1 Tax=Paratrimastix pyriformis TaxID=342808 RepID=A0ABQ8U358_9EUKA|nr:hypothetical protein PAPYR_11767 [Paratrimastix pyriformis]